MAFIEELVSGNLNLGVPFRNTEDYAIVTPSTGAIISKLLNGEIRFIFYKTSNTDIKLYIKSIGTSISSAQYVMMQPTGTTETAMLFGTSSTGTILGESWQVIPFTATSVCDFRLLTGDEYYHITVYLSATTNGQARVAVRKSYDFLT